MKMPLWSSLTISMPSIIIILANWAIECAPHHACLVVVLLQWYNQSPDTLRFFIRSHQS